ncbi:SIR2 family protein [Bdellovibrio sp. GT3]|uniref:SIR2 family protein n=1 Tax=Bdellovibrio sp. GT3 TaxID=3136282 RepID=UPI0030F0B5DE
MISSPQEVERFVEDFVLALREDNAALFAGAGLSIPSGFVNWKELLRDIAKDVNLDVNKESDLVAVAQYHINSTGNRNKINHQLLNTFSQKAKPSKSHEIIASLPFKTVWTTNYDTLIEDAFTHAGKVADVKHNHSQLPLTRAGRSVVVYKMHGDASAPSQAVLTRDDYESFSENRSLFTTALQGDLVNKTFLFLGFSFSDPNINYILSRVRILLGNQNQRQHYCLMRKVQRKDYVKIGDFRYDENKQKLQVDDLKRYGIKTLLLSDFGAVTAILKKIQSKFKRHRVFISGSAFTGAYSPHWSSDLKSQKFIHGLAYELVKKGYDVASGFGDGVGSAVINGALQFSDETGQELGDKLVLKPFPQFATTPRELTSMWQEYRKSMLKNVGVAVFVFGSKLHENGGIVNAPGVRKEFEIARQLGIKLIPVGVTGWMSEQLWNEVETNFKLFYGDNTKIRAQFKKLGNTDSTPNQVTKAILNIIDLITQE